MATNDFKIFANGQNLVGEETLNIAPLDDTTLAIENKTGFYSGLASSQRFNRVLRQGTAGTATLGELITEVLDEDVADNGTNFKDQLRRAINKVVEVDGGYLPLAGGTVTGALTVNGGITGDLTGNASSATAAISANSATQATQDSAGQQINSTYIKSVSVNGRVITFTRGDGTTFTITTQDTVTTNSSNWSVSNGTNGWARDNSTGFTIVWGSASAGGGVWTTFARSFSSVLSVAFAPWDSGNYSWGNNLNNSGFSHHSSGNCKYIAVGFS